MSDKESITQIDHETVMGKIIYLSNKEDRKGQERGREYFIINKHANGHRKIVAHCEIDDRPAVMRDITYSLDENWLPTDCFVRISVDDQFMGSGWFNFSDGHAECETTTALEGRVSQKMETNGHLKTFQNHAIACDAWHLSFLIGIVMRKFKIQVRYFYLLRIIAEPQDQCFFQSL